MRAVLAEDLFLRPGLLGATGTGSSGTTETTVPFRVLFEDSEKWAVSWKMPACRRLSFPVRPPEQVP